MDLTARAIAAATAVAAEHGVRCDDPVVLADGYSTVVHLRPSPVVARVPTLYAVLRPGTAWRAREVEVVRHLQSVGAAVVPLSGDLPPGPHVRDGLTVTFWEYVAARPDAEVTERDLAPALAELHAALATFPGELPVLAGPTHDIPLCLDVLARDPGPLDAVQVRTLHDAHERLRPLIAHPPEPWQPLHGDVFAGNVIPTRDGLLWADLEDTCRGPRAWDVANLRPDPADRRALDLYPDAPSDEELDAMAELRTLQVATWVAAAPRPPDVSPADQASFLAMLLAAL
ncbi:phosphotransferase family protein [Actinomycetospora succinea]|uniref:phosphotransferase family protein n=1 Tax=Actinomycetospora succinea TaxID=663603 RepID=UPI00105CA55B|nr:phosphotransferase [Actinomycetospora succinea]